MVRRQYHDTRMGVAFEDVYERQQHADSRAQILRLHDDIVAWEKSQLSGPPTPMLMCDHRTDTLASGHRQCTPQRIMKQRRTRSQRAVLLRNRTAARCRHTLETLAIA